jgi:polyisoprenyl-phosphate glycosyltransferase
MNSIDIILPVYNEEAGIAAFNEELFRVLGTLRDRYTFEVIYIVDRCRDRSFEVLAELSRQYPNLTVVHLSRRFGHQMSLIAGVDQSKGDALIMMDCDLQHPPEVIPALLEKFDSGFDVVYTIRRYSQQVGFLKRWTSSMFYRFQNSLSPVDIPEGAADFRLISRKVVRLFQTSIREQEQFLRGLFRWVGFNSTYVEFVSGARAAGVTKYNFVRLLQFSVNGIISFSKTPLRFATIMGLVISFGSVCYGFMLISMYLLGAVLPQGYTSLAALILFLGGLQLMVLGIIGEYIGSIYAEVKGRPLYIVDEVVRGGQAQHPFGSSASASNG